MTRWKKRNILYTNHLEEKKMLSIFNYYCLSFKQLFKDAEKRQKAMKSGKLGMRFFIMKQAIKNAFRRLYSWTRCEFHKLSQKLHGIK